MRKKIAIILGDGVGPEVTQQAISALDAVAKTFGHEFEYRYCLMGAAAIDKTGDPLPGETVENCLSCDAVLFGAVGHPRYDNDPGAKLRPEQGLLRLRKALQLYANIRPVTAYPAVQHLSPLKAKHTESVDFVIYRELAGGLYYGDKAFNDELPQAADQCIYTRAEIERIGHLAFRHALQRRRKLTLVDKANVLDTSRLWRKVIREMEKEYPEVTVEYMFVDNAAVQILINPRQFDVLLTENLFGDILSDEASVIAGSPGMLPSASVGDGVALFEPIHGAYPQAAGKDIANPLGSILSAAMMLDHFGLREEAQSVRDAVDWTLKHNFVTRDINPVNFYLTSAVGELICDYICNKTPGRVRERDIEMRGSTII